MADLYEGVDAAVGKGDLDAAIAAFESVVDESPDDERPAPAAAAQPAAPASEPAAQIEAQPSDEDAARAKADVDALLERPVPATDAFPKMFHGQPMRKLVEALGEKDRYITDTRTQLQTKHDELVAAQATARVVLGQLNQLRGGGAAPPAQQEPAAPSADEVAQFYARHGVKDPFKEFTADPMGFIARMISLANADAMRGVTGRFEPIERAVSADQGERQLGTARAAVEQAFTDLCTQKQITDPAMKAALRARFDRICAPHAANVGRATSDPSGPLFRAETWKKIYLDTEEAAGGFGPLVTPTAVIPPSSKANPPSSARAAAGSGVVAGKKVSVRRSQAARDLLEGSGLKDQDDLLVAIENDIATQRDRGMVTD